LSAITADPSLTSEDPYKLVQGVLREIRDKNLEIRVCFSVGNILPHYKTAGQANQTKKSRLPARFATGRSEAEGI